MIPARSVNLPKFCRDLLTYWLVVSLVIDVHEAAVNIRQLFNLVLKVLSNIVRSPKGHVTVHDDVHFDKVVWPRMIHTTGIDLLDRWVEGHGLASS